MQPVLLNFWNFTHIRHLFDSVGRICYLLPTQLFGTLNLLPILCAIGVPRSIRMNFCMKLKSLENQLILVDTTQKGILNVSIV